MGDPTQRFISEADGLLWLKQTHLPQMKGKGYVCVILHGHEDSPEEIHCYVRNHYQCKPDIYKQNEDGNGYTLVQQGEKKGEVKQ